MKLIKIFCFFLFLSLSADSAMAQQVWCPPFKLAFTPKAPCFGTNCTQCYWYYDVNVSLTISVNGVTRTLLPYESFELNAGDVLCVYFDPMHICCYDDDEWCN